MDALYELQKWYHSQCDGDWEHGNGVKIETLDNPGWMVVIELTDTELENKPFTEVRQNMEHETDWINCRVRDHKFEGYGGPFKLKEILETFLIWAAQKHTP